MRASSHAAWRLRPGTLATQDPARPDRVLVFLSELGKSNVLSPVGWELAQVLDGCRTIAGARARFRRVSGRTIDAALLRQFAARLVELEILLSPESPRPPFRRRRRVISGQLEWVRTVDPSWEIYVHPASRFSCTGAGDCCRSGYRILLSEQEADRITAAARRRDPTRKSPVAILPVLDLHPPRFAQVLREDEGGCRFLSPDRRCELHGQQAHPVACQVYPMRFVAALGRIHAGPAHRCLCGAFGQGELLTERLDDLSSRARALPAMSQVRESVQISRGRSTGARESVEALVAASLESFDSPWALLEAAARRLSPSSAGRTSKVLMRTPWRLAEVAQGPVRRAISGDSHPTEARARERHAHLDPKLGAGEIARFVRDHLFTLQPFRFPTLFEGLFACALAVRAASARLRAHPSDPLGLRLEIMSWEDALTDPNWPRLLRSAAGISAQRPAAVIGTIREWAGEDE